MSEQQIVFDDGATYDRYMGRWSRIVGDVFLDWLAPGRGLRWLDVGCGNGAFTDFPLYSRVAVFEGEAGEDMAILLSSFA